ncbi:MAG: efflux RND transporter permease subunit [Chitinophagales bacterium]
MSEKKKEIKREFGISSFAVNNRTSVIILMFLIVVTGVYSYMTMPKENFPEINIPTIYVGVTYPGNSPLDMENLVTRHIEKEINTITGVTKIQSTAIQDYSTTVVEFDFDVDVAEVLQEVKDAVDKAKSELPSDLDTDPNIFKMDFSEIPVINVNISGENYSLEQLKGYGEYLEDEIEGLSEISKVELRGALEKEVKIEVDKSKMDALQIGFRDIEDAIGYENTTMSAGDILIGEDRRSIRITGEFKTIDEIADIIVKNEFQQTVFLNEIADVKFTEKEADSYANIFGKPVISLDVMKRGGENLIIAVDKINEIVLEAQENRFPKDLEVTITNDTSRQTKIQVENLENSIISGVILVVLVLLFFLGLRNALFVGVAIPLSMVMGFLILSAMDITLNIMVLFSLILALGMLVDNGIVVVENIYRMMQEGKDAITASKEGVGEVAIPIIASTATTLAAFFPLIFWGDIMGEFMKYLPITLIIVLSSSLFVALVINPVLTSFFMKVEDINAPSKKRGIRFWIISITALVIGTILLVVGLITGKDTPVTFGMFFLVLTLIILLNIFVLSPLAKKFQLSFLPRLENAYEKVMKWALKGSKPVILFVSMVFLFFGSIAFLILSPPEVVFFPEGSPNYVNVFIEYPTGTDISKTNALTKEIEGKVLDVMEKYGTQVESVLTNVGSGTSDPNAGGVPVQGATPNKAKLTVSFVSFQERTDLNTDKALQEIRDIVGDVPGAIISVSKDPNGPPVGPPISIAISGEDYGQLIEIHDQVRLLVANSGIQGIEELKSDLDQGKPELIVNVNRKATRTYGLSTIQVASALRTALFGKEISKFKEGDEDYPIMLRLKDEQRYDLEALKSMGISFRDAADGKVKQVPIAAIADLEYSSTLGSVNRNDLDRVVSLYSNVLDGYVANNIMTELGELFEEVDLPDGYEINFTGEQEQQAESMAFLLKALMISVCVIFLIIVAQFNSITTPFIIMFSVVFSTIGVFLGIGIFGDKFVVIMTMIGIISLAGVVVNNAIVLIDFTELTRDRLRAEKGYKGKRMPKELIHEAIITAGKTRLRPVLLTAITTVLGLIPLAVGININFFGLMTKLDPQFYLGGDNVVMWGPLSWTVIYGLTFATFLTLVIVPVMILIFDRMSNRMYKLMGKD